MTRGSSMRDMEKRRRYIVVLKSRARPLTSAEVGQLIGARKSTALQMLYSLERDKVVGRVPGGGKSLAWRLTGNPLPNDVSAIGAIITTPRFDAGALADALDIRAFPVLQWTRTVMLGDPRK